MRSKKYLDKYAIRMNERINNNKPNDLIQSGNVW